MAIKKNITLENNFGSTTVFNDCYIKCSSLFVTKDFIHASIAFMSEKDGKTLKVEGFRLETDLNGVNFFTQTYNHLKSLPEYSGAVDC